ncbi:MAG: alanine racemase [Verrucomicrobiales bacterium]
MLPRPFDGTPKRDWQAAALPSAFRTQRSHFPLASGVFRQLNPSIKTTAASRTWAEIDLSALDHNLRFAQSHSGHALMAVIKAGAYGHGLLPLARHLDQHQLPFLGVAHIDEARRLHQARIRTPLYLLSATSPGERAEIAAKGWTPCLCTLEEIHHFGRLSQEKPLTAHLAIDTGMGRGGLQENELPEALSALRQYPALKIGGIGSHLPVADEDADFTRGQFADFDRRVTGILATSGWSKNEHFHIHLSNSAGLLAYQSETTNLARPGLLLYGLSPLPEYQQELRPVLTLKTHVSLVQELPAGHGVSYGRTLLSRDTRIAVLGIGYGDGYPRALSGQNAHALIHGRPCPLLGRVTMDQIIVDVTHLPDCQAGDHATLFGRDLLVSELATKAGTIPWEILTQLTPRVERRYLS